MKYLKGKKERKLKYSIFSKDNFGDMWTRSEVADDEEAKKKLLELQKEKVETVLVVEVPFELELKIGEVGDPLPDVPEPPAPTAEEIAAEEARIAADQDQTE